MPSGFVLDLDIGQDAKLVFYFPAATDISNSTMVFTLRTPDLATVVFTKTTAASQIVIDSATQCTITLDAADSTALAEAAYPFSLWRTDIGHTYPRKDGFLRFHQSAHSG